MVEPHPLLGRQLRRAFGTEAVSPPEWRTFVEAVDAAYRQADADRRMLERSLEISSGELLRANAELRLAEERSRESEKRYRDLFENALVGVFRSTGAGEILECNDAFAHILGFDTADEARRQPAASLYAQPAERARFLDQVRARRTFTNHEIQGRKKDGSTLWLLENVAYRPQNADGGILEGTAIDVTDLKRAELDRQESLALFRSLVTNVQAGVIIERADRTIFAVNASFCRIFEIPGPPEALAGLDCVGTVAESRRLFAEPDGFVRRIEAILQRAEVVIAEEVDFADGRTFERDYVPIWGPDGAFFGHMWQYRDVTERRSLELQLRQAQKMDAMGRLAGGVAHDFNNLLTLILGYCELLVQTVTEPSVRGPLEEIRDAGERAASLTRQLLAFSRKQVLQPRTVDVNVIVEDLRKMLVRLIGADVRVETHLDPGLAAVRADAGGLEQILLNLAVNARDAMPNGGRLALRTRNANAEEINSRGYVSVGAGTYVLLEVADTGSGMDPEVVSHAFEPFFTTKEKGKGTGLGLATVCGIVEQSGGHVWLDSEPGRGTTVTVCLPAVDAPLDELPSRVARPRRHGTGTVLVVEDEQGLRPLVRKILAGAGYRVLDTCCAAEALRLAEGFPGTVDLLLADVILPDTSGPAVADQIRRCRPEARVVFMSGHTDSELLRNGALEDGAAYLQKPFTAGALLEVVGAALESGSPTSALEPVCGGTM